jgi:peroxiredoxin
MKQLLNRWTLLGILLFTSTLVSALDKDGYNIRVRIDGYKNDTCILAHHYGDKKYISATVTSKNEDNEFIFEGEEPLKGGIYVVLIKENNNYFEFLVPNEEDQKDLILSTKLDESKDLSKHLKIEGSKDNQAYLDYMKFNAKLQKEKIALQEKVGLEKQAKKKEKLQNSIKALDAKLKAYQLGAIEKNPNFLSSKLIAEWIVRDVPEAVKGDKFAWFYWTRAHFWDHFDFSDERLIRTPLFKYKMEIYTEKLTPTVPDSVIAAVDEILQKAKLGKNKVMFQYAASELLNKYAKSKIICMDAVYVFLGEKYYCSGEADWVDSVQLERICENVASIKPLQCGMYAPNVRLKKLDGTPIHLYDVKAKYTAVYFWSPSCGNCSKTSAKLVPIYDKYKDKGFEIFGICSESWKNLDQCKKKVAEKGMIFINTSEDSYPLAVAKKYYDLKVNPYILLLDEDKKIMFKRIDPQQIDDILQREFGLSPEELKKEEK